DSLTVTDQRKRPRQQTEVPVDLYLQEGAPPHHCILADFADLTVRLRCRGEQKTMPPMEPNDRVTIVIDFGELAKTYLIKSSVFRRTDDYCVLNLEQLYKDGDFAAFKLMDTLEIKTGLLNYGC
ncbi:MAG TPA: hypothetical protein VMB75_06980, partial [Rhodocyclaceae bacterium]|nr:hypothetical protein [Rhodocyclaceae bacterium]